MSENKNRKSTKELVDVVIAFCELFSGLKMYPYQEQFARRIIRSVLTNDGNEITALFSRQCILEGELIHTREGDLVKIEDHPDSWVTNENAKVLEIKAKGGYVLKCTANHPVMTDHGWVKAGLLRLNDKIVVLSKWDKHNYNMNPEYYKSCSTESIINNVLMKTGHFNNFPLYEIGEDGEELSLSDIISIAQLEGTHRVYDVTYPNKGWFICNGVKVHNSGKSETVSMVSAGLMVILPKLANMPMFADDPRLQMFKRGVMIGIFAPSQRQAQTTYGKIRNKVEGQRGLEILSDPDFKTGFSTSNGTTVALTNGSFVTAISASDGANIEGESFQIIICEECLVKGSKISTPKGLVNVEDVKVGDNVLSYNHDLKIIEHKKVLRSFNQQLYERKIVTITLSNGETLKCTDNHKIFLNNEGYFRADLAKCGDFMLSYTPPTQEMEKLNDNKRKPDVNRNPTRGWEYLLPRKRFKKSSIHPKSIFQTRSLCNVQIPIHREILQQTSKKRGKYGEGSIYNQNNYKMSSIVQRVPQSLLPQWEKTGYSRMARFTHPRGFSFLVHGRWFNEGNNVFTHKCFSTRRKFNDYKTLREKLRYFPNNTTGQTSEKSSFNFFRLRKKQISQTSSTLYARKYDVQDTNNRRVKKMCNLWKRFCTLQKHFLSLFKGVQERTTENILQTEILRSEKVFITGVSIEEHENITVYDLTVEDNHNFFSDSVLVHNCQDISDFKIQKSISPMGAAYNATFIKIGTASTKKGDFYHSIQRNKKDFEDKVIRVKNHFEYNYLIVSKYNEKYRKYVEQEKRRLGEKSDAFRLSYCLEWILQRGMFIDIADFEANNVNPDYDIVPYDKTATHVVGIDVGGGSDSTVVTVTEVDWKMPVVLESRTDEETGEEVFYQCYNTYVKAWKEISNTPNFEEQYTEIMHFLSNYKIARVVIDTTKERALADRINANTAYEVVQYVFSSKSKSDLYKNFEREVNSGRVNIPGGEETKKTGEYNRCLAQLQDLEKSWRGSYMVVAHPPTKEGRDDYPDSMALSILGCMNKGFVNEITTTNDRRGFISGRTQNMYLDRNKFTGRRR